MMGKVDFNKDMDFWQLDKWNGFFPVKWHVIKDIPNFHLRHIILENNENKPVTHSRDTQEVISILLFLFDKLIILQVSPAAELKFPSVFLFLILYLKKIEVIAFQNEKWR